MYTLMVARLGTTVRRCKHSYPEGPPLSFSS